MKRQIWQIIVGLTLVSMGCRDIVVKVNKNHRDVKSDTQVTTEKDAAAFGGEKDFVSAEAQEVAAPPRLPAWAAQTPIGFS